MVARIEGRLRRERLLGPLMAPQGQDLMARAVLDGGSARVRPTRPLAAVVGLVPEAFGPTLEAVAAHEVGAGKVAGEPADAAEGGVAGPAPATTPIGVVRGREPRPFEAVRPHAGRAAVIRTRTCRDIPRHAIAQVVGPPVRHLRRLGAAVRVGPAPEGAPPRRPTSSELAVLP